MTTTEQKELLDLEELFRKLRQLQIDCEKRKCTQDYRKMRDLERKVDQILIRRYHDQQSGQQVLF